MKTVQINAVQPFEVIVGHGLLSSVGEAVLKWHPQCHVALISDETVHGLYGRQVSQSLETAGFEVIPFYLPSGDANKSMQAVADLLNALAGEAIGQTDLLIGLGGGTVGDITGFVAASYLGGVQYAHIPTTLWAAVDIPVDGEVCVHLGNGKNLAGLYWPPKCVLCDCTTLNTLPSELFLDGVAECLKLGVVYDRALFEAVARGDLDGDCMDIIVQCATIKAKLFDPALRSTGGRQLLHLGHTMADAIAMLSQGEVTHGNCLSIGIVGTARVAEALGLCVMGCGGILMAMMDRLGLECETPYSAEALAQVVLKDKRRPHSTLSIILPESIGHCVRYPAKREAIGKLFHLAKGGRL